MDTMHYISGLMHWITGGHCMANCVVCHLQQMSTHVAIGTHQCNAQCHALYMHKHAYQTVQCAVWGMVHDDDCMRTM